MNYCASFLKYAKRELLDDSGNHILTISYTSEKMPFHFKKPTIKFDFITPDESKVPDIKELSNEKELESLGFALFSTPVLKTDYWLKGKKIKYLLRKSTALSTLSERKVRGDTRNAECFVQYDRANNLVRLVGARAGPNGFGPWMEV
jgi:hypothetical protein